MATLRIEVNCGETTCAVRPGEFCAYAGSTHFGQRWVCRLFPSDTGSYTTLGTINGWLQRCQACLDAAED